MLKIIFKFAGVYCIFFVIVVSVAFGLVDLLNVTDDELLSLFLFGYACGVIISIPAVLVTLRIFKTGLRSKGE